MICMLIEMLKVKLVQTKVNDIRKLSIKFKKRESFFFSHWLIAMNWRIGNCYFPSTKNKENVKKKIKAQIDEMKSSLNNK